MFSPTPVVLMPIDQNSLICPRSSKLSTCTLALLGVTLFVVSAYLTSAQTKTTIASSSSIPSTIMLRIIRAEDERRWNSDLSSLLSAENPSVRKRALLAAGRIGDERALAPIASLLDQDSDQSVRAMAAFSLGEIQSFAAAEALMAQLSKDAIDAEFRGRLVEALGKIAGALPESEQAHSRLLGEKILQELEFEAERQQPRRELILLGLTAAIRAKPAGAGAVIALFLTHSDARVRADAANALARLRLPEGNEQLRKSLTSDTDANVRANAARVLGATEDREAFTGLLDRALKDTDSRVRISAIRALASLKDPRAAAPLLERGKALVSFKVGRSYLALPSTTNEILELAAAMGRVSVSSEGSSDVRSWLLELRTLMRGTSPEVEISLARVSPQLYSVDLQAAPSGKTEDWRRWAALAQGAAELVNLKTNNSLFDASVKHEVVRNLESRLSCLPSLERLKIPIKPGADTILATKCFPLPTRAAPDYLRALAAYKPQNLDSVLKNYLKDSDVIVRATAAELLGALSPNEANAQAEIAALHVALRDKELNDAALALLDTLSRQKSTSANEAIRSAFNSQDNLIRRRAIAVLKANGAGDFSDHIGTVKTGNSAAVYERAAARIGKRVRAIVSTTRGSFTIELLPEDAPLNVDNFVQLARHGYFRGLTFHRVVPNFVIQGGDPRGDGNGGPGYQVRCEINQVPYERGAVGMALSGKDTGGSQWFVTHGPQPHLDGGYTVFGKVIEGMDVVDAIVRGDIIQNIFVTERPTK